MTLSQQQLEKLEQILLDTPARYAIPVLNYLNQVNVENTKQKEETPSPQIEKFDKES